MTGNLPKLAPSILDKTTVWPDEEYDYTAGSTPDRRAYGRARRSPGRRTDKRTHTCANSCPNEYIALKVRSGSRARQDCDGKCDPQKLSHGTPRNLTLGGDYSQNETTAIMSSLRYSRGAAKYVNRVPLNSFCATALLLAAKIRTIANAS